MVPTMLLPATMSVADIRDRVHAALEEFDAMEPTKYALAHWVTRAYRDTLVVGGREHWPLVLPAPSDVEAVVAAAKAELARAREAARSLDGELIDRLPRRVHVVRVKDARGSTGFAPIDIRGASLTARVLSLLLADYLMQPEKYLSGPRAA